MATVQLPTGRKIRFTSNFRYVLVADRPAADKPYVERRSNDLTKLRRIMADLAGRGGGTSYFILDQAEGNAMVDHRLHVHTPTAKAIPATDKKERTMTTATAPEAAATVTATIAQLLPGQEFVYGAQLLRFVKGGKASFRAATEQGTVTTFKASPSRKVQLAPATEQAPSADADVIADLAAKGAAKAAAAPAQPKARKAGQPNPALPAKGEFITDAAGSSYLVTWPHRHDVLAKLVSGEADAPKWLVQCAHGSQAPATSAGHGDGVGRNRKAWCTSCAAE